MGNLRLSGLLTGIDTTEIVKKLMIVNSQRLSRYKVKKINYETQNTALDELRSKVGAFESSVTAISSAKELEAFKVSSSDGNRLGLNASASAAPGTHTVRINQLATAETWIQDASTFDYKTDYVDAGNFIYSYNYQESVITATATTTLEDFVDLINNDEDNPGVSASLLKQGNKYHLMLSGQETGEDYQISVNSSSTEIWITNTTNGSYTDAGVYAELTTKIADLDQLSNTISGTETITVTGVDRDGGALADTVLTLNAETTIKHLIDSINTHYTVGGVAKAKAVLVNGEIRVTDVTSGASSMTFGLTFAQNAGSATLTMPTTIAVSAEGGATTESISDLVSTTFIQTQNAQNAEYRIDGFPPVVAEVQDFAADGTVDGGTFTLTYGGQTTAAIAWDATAAVIQSALEALSTVNANDITVSDTLTAGLTFTFANTLGNVGSITIGTTSLTNPTLTDGLAATETTQGRYEWTTGNSNTVTDALTGVSLFLFDVNDVNTSGSIIDLEVTVTRDTGSVSGKVQGMVGAYNDLMTFLIEKTEYDTETKKMGTLSRDTTVSLLKSQIKSPFNGVVTGFSSDDKYTQASDLGLTLDGHNMLKLDSTKLNDILTGSNFADALDLIGALATGNSNSSTVEFYSADDTGTTAGTYNIIVSVDGAGTVTKAQIKLSSESAYRNLIEVDASNDIWGGSIADDARDSRNNPLYPEYGLQVKIDTSAVVTNLAVTLRIKKGFAGTLVEMLDDITKTGGRLDIGDDTNQDYQDAMTLRIEDEEKRLDDIELRLINKFARLEKTLADLQSQMASVSALVSSLGG